MNKLQEFLSKIDELETLKKQAIEEVLLKRLGLDATLAKLGYLPAGRQGQAADGKRAKRQSKPCRVCGQMGHNAARHRAEKQGEERKAPQVG